MKLRRMTLPVAPAVAAVAATSLLAASGFGAAAFAGTTTRALPGTHRAPDAAATASSLLERVTVAPKSSDAWATVLTLKSSSTSLISTVAHLHAGHWSKLAVKGKAGSTLELRGIAAGSTKQIWAVGATVAGSPTYAETPLLEKSTGGGFKPVSVKGSPAGASLAVIAASSPKNAWAMGDTSNGTSSYTLHWNGKKWTEAPLLIDGTVFSAAAISTTSAKNVWAVGDIATGAGEVIHWNGKSWSVSETVPVGQTLAGIATTSAHTWAVGYLSSSSGVAPLAIVLSGSKWKSIHLAHSPQGSLQSVAAVGGTAYAVGSTDASSTEKPFSVTLKAAKGAYSAIKKEHTYSSASAVAASSKTIIAVGSYFQGAQCSTPEHPLAEQLIHSRWSLLSVPAKVAPATKTGTGICG